MPTDTWVKGVADLAESKKPPVIDQAEVDRALNNAVELSRSQVGSATYEFETIPMEEKGKRLVQLNDLFMRATVNARVVSTFAREWNNYSIKWREDYCHKYLKHLSMAIEALYNIKKLDVGYSQEQVAITGNDLLQGSTRLKLPFPEISDKEPAKLKHLVVIKTKILNNIIASLPEKSKHSLTESILSDFYGGRKYQ